MNNMRFSELCRKEFYIDLLLANGTKEKPDKVFKCPKNLRQWERFMYVTSGRIALTTEKGTVTTGAGEIMYLPYDVAYSSEWLCDDEIGYITIEFILREKSGERLALSDSVQNIIRDKSGSYRDMFEKIFSTFIKGEIGYRIKAKSDFLSLLHLMTLDSIKSDLKNTHRSIYKAILYVENNYTDDISVEKLAEMCGMCQSYFRKSFLDYSGMSPIKYKNYLRAKKAAELLETGEYTISEAAEMVGIDDLAYFNRVFKKTYGKPPRDYIKN